MSTVETSTPAVRSVAEVPTDQAERYRKQLCKHFQHKLPVREEGEVGIIPFSIGEARVESSATILTLSLSAPDEGRMEELKDVVVRHLERFAFREELAVTWRDA